MSDLDSLLAGLREELNLAIPLPDVEQVTDRARARRRLQLGAIAAVVAVAVAVPVLRVMQPGQQAGNPPTGPRTSYVLDFADPDLGYALGRRCEQKTEGCTFTFYRTADGGRDWQKMTLPKPSNTKTGYFSASFYVVGPDQVVIDQPGGEPFRMNRIQTTDGGRSWHPVDESRPAGTRDPLSPTGLLTGTCGTPPSLTEFCDSFGTIQPGSGKDSPLLAQPPLGPGSVAGPVATKDGRWWVCGQDGTTKRWMISVSDDGARNWSTSDLNLTDTSRVDDCAVVERNGAMYATASNYGGLVGVWRSLDDGKSWTRTWARTDGRPIPGLVGSPIAAGDGSLVLSDGLTTYVSTDQGATFERTGEKVAGTVRWTRAGYLRSDGLMHPLTSEGTRFALSSDGVQWREFTVH